MATRLATQTPIVARWQTAKARYQRSDSARRKIAVNCLKAKQNDDRRQEAERRVSGISSSSSSSSISLVGEEELVA